MAKHTDRPCSCSNLNCADLNCGRLDGYGHREPDEDTGRDALGRPVTSVEPGCTCGGMAACQQCQERDQVVVEMDLPGQWSHSDFTGGVDEVRGGHDWVGAQGDAPPDGHQMPHPATVGLDPEVRRALVQTIWDGLPGLSIREAADVIADLVTPFILAAEERGRDEARFEVKAAVEEWFSDVSLDDLFAVKGWVA